MNIQSLDQILQTLLPLDLAEPPTPDRFHESFDDLGQIDRGSAAVGIWHGQTPWEFHKEGDEFLLVLQGEVVITLLVDGVEKVYSLVKDSVFIVPAKVWHRSQAQHPVTLLSVLASPHGPVSYADDPRTGEKLVSEAEILEGVSS
ncbi:MAG: cupin domain-containing protein [Cyanobacteria bacterium J06632_22]